VLTEAFFTLRERLTLALVFGSVARGDEGPGSDVDVLLVGEMGFAGAVRALHEAQSSIGREINPVALSSAEFHNKLKGGDTFLAEILGGKNISDRKRE
jgi:predicted nucleotidyltransferase